MNRYEALLLEAIDQMLSNRSENTLRLPILAPTEYAYNLGYLQALRDVKSTCDQIRENLQ